MFGEDKIGPASVADLVRDDGLVHSSVYTDQKIFDLEMERIFHRTWLYVGHVTEVPNQGDYRRKTMGRHPVILVRGDDDKVRVLMNRCRHRGAMVAEVDKGNVQHFRCPYHGWAYDTTGKLTAMHYESGYKGLVDTETLGLDPVPRIGEYRGMVFASLSPTGRTLDEHLAAAKSRLDIAIDVSPTGDIFASHGMNRTKFRGNWKLVGMDGYHPTVLHASMFTLRSKSGQGSYRDPWGEGSESVTRHLGNGHVMLDLTLPRAANAEEEVRHYMELPGGPEYVRDMKAKYGEERALFLIGNHGDPHIGLFPNMQIIGSHIRVIIPLAPGVTEVQMFPMAMGGVSDEINQYRLRRHEFSYGPSSFVQPDDTEIFERTQLGMMAQVNPWLNLTRGLTREHRDTDGTTVAGISDELTQRQQLMEWRKLIEQETV
jgi:phenylpropionate dioxygenase-like ring-hydroxylating dioxygenase large terminal subunit